MADRPGPGRVIPSPRVRAYVYAVLTAAGPVAVFYGLLTREEVALWLGFGGTVLSPAGLLALANTPAREEAPPHGWR